MANSNRRDTKRERSHRRNVCHYYPLTTVAVMNNVDEDIRPLKRQKLEHQTTPTLPADVLLLSLPQLLQHPPTHKHHTRSLFLSLFALRKYLSFPGLDSITECRASTELAEIGFRIGLGEPGIANEVEKSITKSVSCARSLRVEGVFTCPTAYDLAKGWQIFYYLFETSLINCAAPIT